MTAIALSVNGKPVEAEVEPRTLLVDFLRDDLLLTGTHVGCEHGICGACTIEMNGEIARSCIAYAVQCDGAEIRTIESFDDDAPMARLRAAFTQDHALQCGYCTPGMLIAARDLIRRKAGLSEKDIRVEMSGNLCRCTGYMGMVRAIQRVMAEGGAARAGAAKPAWLGPAPGPLAGGATVRAAAQIAAPGPLPAPAPAPAAARRETTGEFTRLTQTITVRHPRASVWRYLADLERIAACLPGAGLDGPVRDGRFTGTMTVRLGPIAARFAGEGTVAHDDAGFSGAVEGQGRDSKSASRARGRIEYRLSEDGAHATRVDIAIAYALAGPLAQFGRSGMVRELVGRLADAFARNLEARLAAPEAEAKPARLDALGLFWGVLWARLRALFGG